MIGVGSKPALLVVDMQNDFIAEEGFFAEGRGAPRPPQEKSLLITSCTTLIDRARQSGAPVIYAQISLRADRLDSALSFPSDSAYVDSAFLVEGTWGAQIVADLTPLPDDVVITKKGNSAFAFTHLDRLLRNMGVDSLVVVGGAVFGSINATVRDASSLGYASFVVPDATYSIGDATCELLGSRSDMVSVGDAEELLALAEGQSYAYVPAGDWRGLLGQSCLLMIDLQNDFVTPGGFLTGPAESFDESGHAAMLSRNVELMDWAHKEEVPVICVRIVSRADQADSATSRKVRSLWGLSADTPLNSEGTWGVEFASGVAPNFELGDIELIKKGHSAFTFTHLSRMLKNLGVKQCIVSGGAIGGCIEETILEGLAHGYAMVAVTDACFRPGDARMQMLAGSVSLVDTEDVVRISALARIVHGAAG